MSRLFVFVKSFYLASKFPLRSLYPQLPFIHFIVLILFFLHRSIVLGAVKHLRECATLELGPFFLLPLHRPLGALRKLSCLILITVDDGSLENALPSAHWQQAFTSSCVCDAERPDTCGLVGIHFRPSPTSEQPALSNGNTASVPHLRRSDYDACMVQGNVRNDGLTVQQCYTYRESREHAPSQPIVCV